MAVYRRDTGLEIAYGGEAMRLFPRRVESGPDQGGRFVFWRWLDIPGPDGSTYLTRLTLLRIPGLQIMLHWIHAEDWSRDPHDHPWPFAAFVLRGGYKEERLDMDRSEGWEIARDVREIRWFNFCTDRAAHRIASVKPKTLTLVITGGKTKSWGFYERTGEECAGAYRLRYVPWREYLGIAK